MLAHRTEFNIRVVNLSLSAGVYESFDTDPLTLAAKKLVDAGIVVVVSAGNQGVSADGHTQYGAITAPGNAPWVLTVGASSHMGTVDRTDDTMAIFSSRGPTAIDYCREARRRGARRRHRVAERSAQRVLPDQARRPCLTALCHAPTNPT